MRKMEKRSAIVIGAGDATGGAIARRFAREGYHVVATRRNKDSLSGLIDAIRAEGGQATGFGSDARDEEAVMTLFKAVEDEIAPIDVMVFNIGANVFSRSGTQRRVFIVRSGRWPPLRAF